MVAQDLQHAAVLGAAAAVAFAHHSVQLRAQGLQPFDAALHLLQLAQRDGVEIRDYAIIYNIVDDTKAMLEGMLKPALHERKLGNAQILEIFDVGKVGKVAGCRVTNGLVRRGANVRLLRDDIVIHDGTLKTLRSFKDDVREVKEGFECGMAFDNHSDLREGDVMEFYEIEEVARVLNS